MKQHSMSAPFTPVARLLTPEADEITVPTVQLATLQMFPQFGGLKDHIGTGKLLGPSKTSLCQDGIVRLIPSCDGENLFKNCLEDSYSLWVVRFQSTLYMWKLRRAAVLDWLHLLQLLIRGGSPHLVPQIGLSHLYVDEHGKITTYKNHIF